LILLEVIIALLENLVKIHLFLSVLTVSIDHLSLQLMLHYFTCYIIIFLRVILFDQTYIFIIIYKFSYYIYVLEAKLKSCLFEVENEENPSSHFVSYL